jgi:hypothetical protein
VKNGQLFPMANVNLKKESTARGLSAEVTKSENLT